MLFERATFLNICYKNQNGPHDRGDKDNICDNDIIAERMEDMSYYMKQFKVTCMRNATNYQNVEIRTSTFSAILTEITKYTFIMLVSYKPDIRKYIL